MKKVIKYAKIVPIFLILLIAIFSTISFASQQSTFTVEESYAHKMWSNLSEEDRNNAIEPYYSEITLKESMRRSTYNELMASSYTTQDDTKYDLRTTLISSITVKNQYTTGSCWAFAGTSMAETTISKKYNKAPTEYSPMHMDYLSARMYNREVGSGGNFDLLLAYLVNGYGPIYESELPFNSVYNPTENINSTYGLKDVSSVNTLATAKARTTDATMFTPIYKEYNTTTNEITYKSSLSTTNAITYTTDEVNAMRTLIKNHIRTRGAVVAYLYTDMQTNASGEFSSKDGYYNQSTNSWYTASNLKVNHAVTIVGWDDTYSADNFNAVNGHKPKNPGAYIVLNSNGTSFGDNGYMYVSYDDALIEQQIMGINNINEGGNENTSIFYTHSELGMNIGFSSNSTSVYAANVYDRTNATTTSEYLNQVGIYLQETEGVEIYVNSSSGDLNANNLELVATRTGSEALSRGYHTISITPKKLTGSKFAVMVKYVKNDSVTGGANLPLECNFKDSGITTSSTYYDTATSTVGESYMSTDATYWIDLVGCRISSSYTLQNTNACIDAYTDAQMTSVHVTGITLNPTTAVKKVGETITIVPTIEPETAVNKKVIWTTSDSSVATVSANGVVTAVQEGTVQITATTEDGGYTAEFYLIAQEGDVVPVTGVALNSKAANIKEQETITLIPTISPANATNKYVVWSSSDDSVATVSNGIILGISEGTTTITVRTVDGSFTDTCLITVEKEHAGAPIRVTGVNLRPKTMTIKIDQTAEIIATISPSSATNKGVIWSSSDNSIATVSEGTVKGMAPGTATITATTVDGGFTDTCLVTVNRVPVTSVLLNPNELVMQVGDRSTLVATVNPTDATDKSVTWSSSDNDIVEVSQAGILTAKKVGLATITVTTVDGGHTATAEITVIEKSNKDDDIYTDGDSGFTRKASSNW